ncbi:hypothetical protein MNV49_007994 [Pseudohyphozyma bogoriensis]|nr:hypothetical protein MNV49_007994 [Pseudohyphozyma bogoriensis]
MTPTSLDLTPLSSNPAPHAPHSSLQVRTHESRYTLYGIRKTSDDEKTYASASSLLVVSQGARSSQPLHRRYQQASQATSDKLMYLR